jgi:hypothetical protein
MSGRVLICLLLGQIVGAATLLPQLYAYVVVSLTTAFLLWSGLSEHDKKAKTRCPSP